jgi:predicted MFS family arabinose efflux permease
LSESGQISCRTKVDSNPDNVVQSHVAVEASRGRHGATLHLGFRVRDPGVILMAVALALLPLAHGFPRFMLSASLFGLGFGSAQPATMALLIDRVRPERRGLATSTYFMGFDAGISTDAFVLGMVSQKWGFGAMWPMAAVCTLMGLAGILGDRRASASSARSRVL